MSVQKIDRLRWFIEVLQEALGWTVELEKKIDYEYNVTISFTAKFRGKAWGVACRDPHYRAVVNRMLQHKMEEVWERETKKIYPE